MEGLTSGVPGDTKPVTFDRFRTGKTTWSGQGPGLFTVRSLVLSYGGRIRAGDAMPGRSDAGAAIPLTPKKRQRDSAISVQEGLEMIIL